MSIPMREVAAFLLLTTLCSGPAAAQAPFQQHSGTTVCVCRGNELTWESASLPDSAQRRLLSLAGTVIPTGMGLLLIASTDEMPRTEGRTLANSAVLWSGLLIGPSVGYWSGDRNRGMTGVLLRSAVFAAAWLLAPTEDFNDGFVPNPNWEGLNVWGPAVITILISDIIDITKAR